MKEMLLPKKLEPFLRKNKRFKVVFGGRGSAKSMTIADLLLMKALQEGAKVGCFREFQMSIEDSIHSLLSAEIERLELPGFTVQGNSIFHENGAEFKFKGLARNPESVKSAHGFKYFFTDEAQTISFESLKNLTPTLREDGSELWFAANLRSMADPFSQRFFVPFEKELRANGYYEDDLHIIIWINYDSNPMFPDVLDQERKHDEKTLSKALYRHIWLGEPYDEVEGSIIPVEWFDATIDSHEKLGFKGSGAIITAFDPSDEGGDTKGLAIRHGSVFTDIKELKNGDANEGCDWAIDEALKANTDWFVWDGDGMGCTLKRQVDSALEGKRVDYSMFKGSEGVDDPELEYSDIGSSDMSKRKTNKEAFKNKRAQYYLKLAQRFYNTYRAVEKGEYVDPDEMISLSSDIKCIDQIRSEVCRIPRKRNNNGKIQIMSKLEMAKKPYELPSPNMADAMMMAMFSPQVAKKKAKKINFQGWG